MNHLGYGGIHEHVYGIEDIAEFAKCEVSRKVLNAGCLVPYELIQNVLSRINLIRIYCTCLLIQLLPELSVNISAFGYEIF